ncbi:MAG: hypothetical protein ABI024_06790 [Vicinamibacterales bacterium]
MARVREGDAPARRRFVWVTATVTVVLCTAIAIAMMNRGFAAAFPPLPSAHGLPLPATLVAVAHSSMVHEILPQRRAAAARVARQVLSPAPLPPGDASVIEPIETQPIALSAIDVPVLERETAVIDSLDIEPLTIEPLATSND